MNRTASQKAAAPERDTGLPALQPCIADSTYCRDRHASRIRRSDDGVAKWTRYTQFWSNGVEDEAARIAAIIAPALQYGRYGYRRVTALLRRNGWKVNVKRVERIWQREGLKVPVRRPKRSRLWLNDGSCLRLRPERPDHVWSYDLVEHRTHNGRKYRMQIVIDEFTRECLAIRISHKQKALDEIDVHLDLFSVRGVPGPGLARFGYCWRTG